MEKCLEGLKVVDFTNAYSGPIATMQLGDFGAEVIKIENNRGGDNVRYWAPMYKGQSLYYVNMNRNKKGMAVNLKTEEGKKIVYELIKDADIVVENYRPGVIKDLGFDYETLKQINPRIIMASLSGYGQTGPYSNRPAYSNLAESMSGLMSITGYKDGTPTGSGVALGDSITGMFLLSGILMALYNREKTGLGQYLEVAMTDALVHMLAIGIIQYSITGVEQGRIGNRDPACFPYDLFETKDGYCIIGTATPSDWSGFARIVGLEHLIDDPRYDTNEKRVKKADELWPLINDWTKLRTNKEIEKEFVSKGECYSPVLKPSEVMQNEQILHRDMILDMYDPIFGEYKMQGIPVKMSRTPGQIYRQCPTQGEHNKEILLSLGYSSEDIARLKEKGVI